MAFAITTGSSQASSTCRTTVGAPQPEHLLAELEGVGFEYLKAEMGFDGGAASSEAEASEPEGAGA